MNPTSAKILLRKMFARRKCAGFGIRGTFNSAQAGELLVHQGFRSVFKRYNISPSKATRLEYNFVTQVAESEFYLQKANA